MCVVACVRHLNRKKIRASPSENATVSPSQLGPRTCSGSRMEVTPNVSLAACLMAAFFFLPSFFL